VSLTICSTAFESLGRAQSKALGHPELPLAIIAHPFGIRSRDEVRAIALGCAEEIARLVTKTR
jgi:hypothetical protein